MKSNFTQPSSSAKAFYVHKNKKIIFPFLSLNQKNRKNAILYRSILLLFGAFFLVQSASAQLNLNFNSYKLKTGTDGSIGAKYLFSKVNDTLDCIVTIKDIQGGASLDILDDNSGNYGGNTARFQPIIAVPSVKNRTSYIRFNFQLIKTGTYNSGSGTIVTPADPVWFRAYDIDGNGVQDNGVKEFVELSSVFTGWWVDAPTQLVAKTPVITGDGSYTISNSGINGDDLSDDHTLAYNGFIYANTVSNWDIIGGATVGSSLPTITGDPTNVGDGDRINSWSFNYTEVLPGVDFGDAPSSYNIPTGGTGTIIPAYHLVPSVASNVTVYLGSVKPDVDYDPSGNASATTDDHNSTTDDEDGFQSTFFPKYAGSGAYTCIVSATNTSGSNAYIYGYIDFNGDGTFNPTIERSALITVPSNSGAKQYFTATFSGGFTYNATSNNRYARFRIASLAADVDTPTGAAANGEVEDYQFNTAMKISGTVYDDANGTTNSKIDGTGKGIMGTTQLYAILLDTAGKVLQSVAVASNGTYTLDSAGTNNKFKVVLSTTNPVFGTAPSVTTLNTLPSGYVYTSEGITATTPAGDGLSTGNFSTTTAAADITTMNFGWNALPETIAKGITINSPASGTRYPLTTVPFSGTDPEVSSAISTGGTFIITTIPTGATLYYNGTAVTAGYKITSYDPTKLTIQFTTAGNKSFTYQTVDSAGYSDLSPATYTITSNNVLPLNDIVLSANVQSGTVKLTLVAKDENQVARYTWEQSTDGTNFTVLSSSAYQTNNAASNVYTFSTTPSTNTNILYFRSVQYSVDGTTLTSNIVAVKLTDAASSQAVAMPTVIKDITNIKISSTVSQTISLNIVDNAGRMVMRKQASLSAGSNTFAVDGWDRMANGAYYIQIVGIENQSVLKVIVQH